MWSQATRSGINVAQLDPQPLPAAIESHLGLEPGGRFWLTSQKHPSVTKEP
jgi:hypothetical protein